mmetsp:Transcript_16115/g.33998  ORF Transcript_16115/g.33998 Transcript_16115/m.33998 type:complete len:286 (-) Transcript_16115:124-981(-)
MLKKRVVQIPIKPRMKRRRGLRPVNVQFELELRPPLHLRQTPRLGRQIDLDDAIGVVAHVERSFRVNIRFELSPRLGVLGHRLLQMAQVVTEMLPLGGLEVGEHLPHHPPHGEVVDVHLIKPLILRGRGEEGHLRVGQGGRGARFQDPGIARIASTGGIDQIVPRMPQRVPPQPFPDRMGLEGVERPSLVVGMVARVRSAVGEDVVFVRLLGVGVGSDLVDPEVDAVAFLVAVGVFVAEDDDLRRGEDGGEVQELLLFHNCYFLFRTFFSPSLSHSLTRLALFDF